MALLTETDGDRKLLHKKSRTICCSCCASCCSHCIQCLSGFIFLLAIAGLVLCARYFLEFPVILNGFKSAMNYTEETVDALIANSGTNQPASTQTCKMFVGSFTLPNEVYLPAYNDTSSADFQRIAQRLQTMINTLLNNSLLTMSYGNSSVFMLRPNPTTANFQMLFCNDNATISGIKADNVLQILRNYTYANISIKVDSITVGGGTPCPTFLNTNQTWPWHIILQDNKVTLCSGSLLSSFWILSSANCVINRDLSLLSIKLGDGQRSLSIDTIIQHPNFTTSPVLSNFALIHLSTPMWFSSSILPICLPQMSQDPTIGSVCSTLVWNTLTSGFSGLAGAVTSELTCLISKTDHGTFYFKPSLSKMSLNQTDTGNALVCMNADGTAYLQGISIYQSNSSLLTSPCLSFSSIGQTISWINSYLLT
ncbi:transmembrane protease serine 11D-like [Anomaloglossus baeobatrachus]|uniref:transmembrane protease serine 11D-like n=1 Tax=Anomaloglossus baeobatrachus TaxID=238106 RepID=UPI003F50C6FA